MWPDRRVLDLFGIELPIIQAPMAGLVDAEIVIAVSEAGGLGSLPCALYDVQQARSQIAIIRNATTRPINLNFFCHTPPVENPERSIAWRKKIAPYYVEKGLDPAAPFPAASRAPFDADFCSLVEECSPEVVSFHFGLPSIELVARVKASGAKVISSATTVAEARWLEARGCDAIIAMGLEAGGHRGSFLSDDMTRQIGTFALVPQIADAVKVPVIAAGGIADARGIVAAFALGASAVQVGTAYLFCPEAKISSAHLAALDAAADDDTVVTNVFTGRPARSVVNRLVRELGPMSSLAPEFPLAGSALGPLAGAEPPGVRDFANLWSGQAVRLAQHMPAAELTRTLASRALSRLSQVGAGSV